ncbi:hypothetical protein GW17_00054533 [Ensete ventricosum]|nr:hypothetical protein GW17_00054533 [Ensete ventricosum]
MDGSHTGLLADQYVPPGNGQFTYWSPRGPVCTACIGAVLQCFLRWSASGDRYLQKEWFFGRDSGNLVTQVSAPRSQALHFALLYTVHYNVKEANTSTSSWCCCCCSIN